MMSSPTRASVPIPASERVESKRSRMMQSSLDLVFSYSRSQQLLYGKHLRSTPSFLDSNPHSSPSPGKYGSFRHDLESYDEEAPPNHLEASAEGPSPTSDPTSDSSSSPNLFPADPFHPTTNPDDNLSLATSSRETRTPRPGLISLSSPFHGIDASETSTEPPVLGMVPRQGSYGSGKSPRVEEREGISPGSRAGEDTPLLPSRDADGSRKPSTPHTTFADTPTPVNRRRSSVATRRFERRRSSNPSGLQRTEDIVIGESTNGQTLFNSVAVLVGIGLLSLPLAFAYAGWVGGCFMLLGFAWVTCHTAKLLARLIRSDNRMMGYTDIGSRAFGRYGGIGINALFCLELFALGVALIVLFGDSLQAIYPRLSSHTYMITGFFLILPTSLLPLRLLSIPSLLSSISSLLLVGILLTDGFSKSSSPGSILHPAETSLWPERKGGNWLGGIGLILAGFGGHACMPGLARDMRDPASFDRVINLAFGIATGISFVAGTAGYLMIGDNVSDEITRDLMQPKYNYPRWLNLFALWMIVINPLTKFGLASRPLNVTIESLLGISPSFRRKNIKPDSSLSKISQAPIETKIPSERRKTALRVLSRTVVTALCTAAAVVLPGFGKVMAFLGSFSAFLICIILPLAFYIRLEPILIPKSERISRSIRMGHFALLGVSFGLMIAGTTWAFMPQSGHGQLKP